MTPLLQGWLAGLPWALALMTAVWAASLPTRDASLVDRFWGLGFVLAAASYLAARGEATPGLLPWLVMALVAIWGVRLSMHITVRNWGKGEDPRYAAMRAAHPGSWSGRSLVTVFWLQAALLWIISAPLAAAILSDRPVVWPLAWAGVVVWAVGFVFEAGGDLQLARFKANPANRGQVLQEGFWRYTRHPNYFGDATTWWGFYLLAASAGGWWTIFAPALMTFFLVRVSGVRLLEDSLRNSKPGYAEYVARTNAFLPGPPKA